MPLMSSQIGPSDEIIKKIVKETVDQLTNKKENTRDTSVTIFVSHSFKEKDPDLAITLKNSLAKFGLNAYLAEKEKQYGFIISEKIRTAIRDSVCVVAILTKNSIISASVNQELGYAMGIGMNLIPLVSEEISNTVGVLLKDVEGEEFNESNFKTKCDVISKYISEQLQKFRKNISINDDDKFRQERGDF